MDRRAFVKSGALGLVTMGLSPSFLQRLALGMDVARRPTGTTQKTLVCLFQRGAADGLNVVVPHGDAAYYDLRPTIAVARPGAQNGAIDLDGFFGLHPSLAPLEPLWRQKLLAPIHAVGSPSSTRSHFDAQDYMETGTPDVKATPDGWLNRLLAVQGTCEQASHSCTAPQTPFRAVAMTEQTPRILEGRVETIAMSTLGQFSVRATGTDAQRLEALYRTGRAELVHGTGREMFDAVKMLRHANPQQYVPRNGAEYPNTQFGQRLLQIAQLIKADVGMEVAFADVGGWDTHVNQGAGTGQLAARLDELSRAIAAFATDLDHRMDDVVVITMSEFGRTARENGTRGTDHGHATAFFVLGGGVRGGRVYGTWPGLAPEQLNEGRDLKLTTDFRNVFDEVAARHLGVDAASTLFPGYSGSTRDWLGVLRG